MNFQEIKVALDQKIQEYKLHHPSAKDSDFKYKRCGDPYIVVLYVPESVQTNESRSNVIDEQYAKFRAEKAYCITILNIIQNEYLTEYSHRTVLDFLLWKELLYKVDSCILPDKFDTNLNEVCTNGIHYFNTLLAAYCYAFMNQKLLLFFADDGSIHSVEFDGTWYLPHEFESHTKFHEATSALKKVFNFTYPQTK